MTSILPEVERVAEDATAQLRSSPADLGALWQIRGRSTTGKSSALLQVADALHGAGLKPIVVAPPARHLDAGPTALVEVASGLAEHGFLNGDYAEWLDGQRSWSFRLGAVRNWLENYKEEVVLLCDEPRQWPGTRGEGDLFAKRSLDVATLLVDQAPCRRIVAGSLPASATPLTRFTLHGSPPPIASWLADSEEWGDATAAAQAVLDHVAVDGLTPLEIRLLVAGTALASVDEVRRWLGSHPPRVAQRLAALVSSDPRFHGLWQAWNALSLTRRPFSSELLDRLPYEVSSVERSVLRHCLLFGDGDLRLHDILRVQAARWRDTAANAAIEATLDEANRLLFSFHHERFERYSAEGESVAALEAMEAFHFASNTGDHGLVTSVRPYFVEQLDALGWSLSYEHHRFAEAADVFAAAIGWDDDDDYAHHYRAFNLERSAGDVRAIDAHYQAAIERNDQHTWWHSRYIQFLVGRGRIADARIKWDDALVALGVGEGDADASLYETLHCWVAGALLASSELTFAREVLDEVPERARSEISGYAALRHRLEALLEAHEWGAFVPAQRLRAEWWKRGPELLQNRLGDDQVLVRWLAARVERIDQAGVHLRVADVQRDSNERPQVGATTLSRDDYQRLNRDAVGIGDLEPGMHLEIGLYAPPDEGEGSTVSMLRVLEPIEWSDESLRHFRSDRRATPA